MLFYYHKARIVLLHPKGNHVEGWCFSDCCHVAWLDLETSNRTYNLWKRERNGALLSHHEV